MSASHQVHQELWRLQSDLHAEARGLFEPLADTYATHMNSELEEGTLAERVRTPSTEPLSSVLGELPYGEQYLWASPLMLKDITRPLDSATPSLPTTQTERDEAVRRYLANTTALHTGSTVLTRIAMDDPTVEIISRSYVKDIADHLQKMGERGLTLDPDKWAMQCIAAYNQITQGSCLLDSFLVDGRAESIANSGIFNPDAISLGPLGTGRFDTYIGATTDAAYSGRQGFTGVGPAALCAPIGPYGKEIAEHLLLSTVYGMNAAGHILPGQADRLAVGHEKLIKMRMARGRTTDGRTPGEALVASTQEGMRSDLEVKSLLLANTVPGYDNPRTLLADIQSQGLVEKFTRALPLGSIGPMVLAGMYIPDLITHNGDRRPDLNADVMHEIKKVREVNVKLVYERLQEILAQGETDLLSGLVNGFGLPCVAAMPGGALGSISKINTAAALSLAH